MILLEKDERQALRTLKYLTSATDANLFFLFIFFLTLNYWELVRARHFSPTGAVPADLRGGERAAHNLIGSLSADLFTPPCVDLSTRANPRPRPPPR